MDASIIVASDPHVLQNLQRCPHLTPAQQAALNTLLASGRTMLGWVGGPHPLCPGLPSGDETGGNLEFGPKRSLFHSPADLQLLT